MHQLTIWQIFESKALQKITLRCIRLPIHSAIRKLGFLQCINLTWTSRPQRCVTSFVLHSMTFQSCFFPSASTRLSLSRDYQMWTSGVAFKVVENCRLSQHLESVLCLSVSAWGVHLGDIPLQVRMFVKLVFLNFRLIEDKSIQVHADESVQEKIASAPQLTRLVSHMAQIPYKFQIYSPSNKL